MKFEFGMTVLGVVVLAIIFYLVYEHKKGKKEEKKTTNVTVVNRTLSPYQYPNDILVERRVFIQSEPVFTRNIIIPKAITVVKK